MLKLNRALDGLLGVLSMICAGFACIVLTIGRWDIAAALFAAAIYADMARDPRA